MVQQLLEKAPALKDYIEDYLNDPQIAQEMFRVGREGFATKGRGVVVIDLRRFSVNTVRFYYLSSAKGQMWDDNEMEQIVQSYDPEQEVIIFLFYGEFSPQNDCYKLASNAC
ncbi:MAG: hypothetical protein KDJ65_29850 [Anaerolineae bacterium]|nr:hypothetical protein [Anaerolineae bacterium]